MSVVRIPFHRSLVNVALSCDPAARHDHRDAAMTSTNDTHAADANSELNASVSRSLDAIEQHLRSLDRNVQQQFQQLTDHVSEFAKRIAKQALGSDSGLLEERVVTFAEALLRQVKPDQTVTFFVNPACVAKLESWTASSDRPLVSIQGDVSVQAGDCRMETAEKGFLASLDAFLDAASVRNTNSKGGI